MTAAAPVESGQEDCKVTEFEFAVLLRIGQAMRTHPLGRVR